MDFINPELLTVHEVAKRMTVSPRQVWALLKAGRLPKPVHLNATTRPSRRNGVTRWLDRDISLFIVCRCNMGLFEAEVRRIEAAAAASRVTSRQGNPYADIEPMICEPDPHRAGYVLPSR